MADRLMTNEDLKLVTGKQRYPKQAEWFRRQFNFDPPRPGKNAVVVTGETFQALQERRAGHRTVSLPSDPAPPVYLLRKG
ncbi:hypothetical protein PPGU19_071990 (plasmid) [Paraburkholderia sp. PGU19]|uniref:DUF4224 domain-containing protein n=1 Tax=Paraburkholderia sp. PGU19 TaxID=2735434 RepID=UPI0015DB431F|nr:DUF4224 domain-containing protein [Paraburkholderia sp. PGU19]BCG02631.1 hypothetical protein PPGU19_071990 [Paraburkholderia sp. PGU19]